MLNIPGASLSQRQDGIIAAGWIMQALSVGLFSDGTGWWVTLCTEMLMWGCATLTSHTPDIVVL